MGMKHVAAYLLLALGGKASPSAADISAVISAAGAEADAEAIETLLKELEGKELGELLAEGKKLLANVSIGGGGGGGGGGAAAPAGGGGGAAPAKKEEKKEEEEEVDIGAGNMFGGDGDGY